MTLILSRNALLTFTFSHRFLMGVVEESCGALHYFEKDKYEGQLRTKTRIFCGGYEVLLHLANIIVEFHLLVTLSNLEAVRVVGMS